MQHQTVHLRTQRQNLINTGKTTATPLYLTLPFLGILLCIRVAAPPSQGVETTFYVA